MKKLIIAGVAALATAASVSAQGTLSAATATGAKPRITVDGVNATQADNIWAQLLVAGSTGLTGAAAEPFQLGLAPFTGLNAGLFSKGVLTVGGKAGGATVDVTIRAWDKDTGADFDSATARASSTFSMALGGAGDPPGPPAGIVGAGLFGGLNVVTPVIPEPSTYALAALGIGGLLFLRRK